MNTATPVGCVLMAGGASMRFGANKLLADCGGQPLIARALSALPQDAFAASVVVTRYPEVMRLAKAHGLQALYRPEETAHASGTIREGLRFLGERFCGYCFMVADQPLLRPESVRALVQAFAAEPGLIWALGHAGQKGNPVIFPAQHYEALCTLSPDETGSAVIRRHRQTLRLLPVENPLELADIDTAADLLALQEHSRFS